MSTHFTEPELHDHVGHVETPRRRRWGWLLNIALVVTAVAVVGGLATDIGPWYTALEKPAFNPPNWLFGPVWTLLYALMTIAAWRVVECRGPRAVRLQLALFFGQLALNLAWTFLFFGAHRPDLALVDIVALDVAVLATGWAFSRVDRVAAWLLVPYAAWIAFATILNAAIVHLNP